MATGDPILVGNANRGDVGFGDPWQMRERR